MKREVERGGPFTLQDTARDIAAVVFRTISPPRRRAMWLAELNRLVRAAEAAEART